MELPWRAGKAARDGREICEERLVKSTVDFKHLF